MSASSIAAAAVANQKSQLQMAMQAVLLKTQFKQDVALAQLIAEATEGGAKLAASPPAGAGIRLDISV
jgi:hypothetical protein